jgi:hypothetical protein
VEAKWAPEQIRASFHPNHNEAKAIPEREREPLRYGQLDCNANKQTNKQASKAK